MVLICAYSTHLFLICRPNLQVSAVSTGDKTSSLAKRPSPKQILGPKLKTVTVVTGVIKSHQESSGVIRSHQESPGVIRSHQESSGVDCKSRLSQGMIRPVETERQSYGCLICHLDIILTHPIEHGRYALRFFGFWEVCRRSGEIKLIKYVVPGTVEQIVGLHSVGLSQGRLKKFRVQKQKRTDLSDQLCIQSISWHAELKSCMVVKCASTTYLRSSTNSIHIFYLDILSIQCCTFIHTHTLITSWFYLNDLNISWVHFQSAVDSRHRWNRRWAWLRDIQRPKA